MGSLSDSYDFKESSLINKIMSIIVPGATYYIISYNIIEDVMRGILNIPSLAESLRYIRPRFNLIHKQRFRGPTDYLYTSTIKIVDPSS